MHVISIHKVINISLLIEKRIKMNVFLHALSLTLLAASVSGQNCVEKTLACNETAPTIYKLSAASCACNQYDQAGSLKYDNGKVYVCWGKEWKSIQIQESYVYGTENNPGYSCKDMLDKAGQQLSNGVFWIRLRGKRCLFALIYDKIHDSFYYVYLNLTRLKLTQVEGK